MTAMKSISKFISLALLIAAATACNTKEIDKPDIPDQPQISGNVKFTASMKQTRVEYSVNGDKLHQCWEENDVIYGFYGDNPVGKVTLKVTEVDADEYATLEATDETEGAAFIAAIKEKGTKLNVGLLYTGSDNEVSGNTITVDMSDQSEGRIPACIESSAIERIIEDEESGDTIVYFEFNNVCAILEIQSLTGIENELPEGQTIDLKSVSVSGVDESCTFTYAPPGFSQESESEPGSAIIVRSSDDRPLKADSDGNIIDADGNRSCIRIAVCPNFKSSITITATSTASQSYSSKYQGSLFSSECYIICAKDVVAKTEDGFYFTTVKAAFDHAKYLNVNSLLGDKPNIVTLVKNCSFGDDDINIDGYDVILDLNGKTLSQDGEGMFYVQHNEASGASNNDSSFTIRDSNGGGIIEGSNDYWIVDNYGVLNIESGSLDAVGDTQTIYNEVSGTIKITGGELLCENWSTIDNCGSLTIEDGKIYSKEMPAIISKGYNLIIGDESLVGSPEISSSCSISLEDKSSTFETTGMTAPAILISPNSDILKKFAKEQATFTMYSGTVIGVKRAITMLGNVVGEINGGILDSGEKTLNVLDGASCTISGGQIYSSNEEEPTIFCGCTKSSILGTSLIIESGNKEGEPLIYSLANIGDIQGAVRSDAPVCAVYNQGHNYATVNICGGYLYSSSGYFYLDNDAIILNGGVSIFSSTGAKEFYSNCNSMAYYDKESAKQYTLLDDFGITSAPASPAPSFTYNYLINSEDYDETGAITFGYKMTKSQ